MNTQTERIHATTVAIDGEGVLIRGAPGAGKSDLALRLIDGGAQLVADDYTDVEVIGADAVAHAPDTIKGLLEVRGVGVMRVGAIDRAPVKLIVDLDHEPAERLPEHVHEFLDGIAVARIRLNAFEASAPSKVRMALAAYRDNLFIDAGGTAT